MGRIRSLKPEFPQSESMGRVSRDARLLFIMLFTMVDDEGRTRAASRMLASLLFPYDDDAPQKIPGWLEELQEENCITIYAVDGNTYLQVVNWSSHQKIDHPTKSKLPANPNIIREDTGISRESSRMLAPDLDQGMDRTKEGRGVDSARSAHADEAAQAIEAYNIIARELSWPEAVKITKGRLAKLRERLREVGGIPGWRDAMSKARASPFLRGESGRAKGHEKWAPDIDFFLQQSSFTKLLEGKYDDRDSKQEPNGFGAVIAGARAAAFG